jgi:hypothetical protein
VGPETEPRVALITVNCSTSRVLKLMLATLSEQHDRAAVDRLVIVDNDSRDGGLAFLLALEARMPSMTLVIRRWFPTHAHGMRAGVAALRRAEHTRSPADRAGYLLFVDPDVIWRDPTALGRLLQAVRTEDAVLAGEWRTGANRQPDIQASFVLVRRDAYDDPATAPPIDGGAPLYRMERSIVDRGLATVDFPANRAGYVLHRGRTAVAAAAGRTVHPYGRAVQVGPHYMGVPDGARIWSEVEQAHAHLLEPDAEPTLVDLLATRFSAPR